MKKKEDILLELVNEEIQKYPNLKELIEADELQERTVFNTVKGNEETPEIHRVDRELLQRIYSEYAREDIIKHTVEILNNKYTKKVNKLPEYKKSNLSISDKFKLVAETYKSEENISKLKRLAKREMNCPISRPFIKFAAKILDYPKNKEIIDALGESFCKHNKETEKKCRDLRKTIRKQSGTLR